MLQTQEEMFEQDMKKEDEPKDEDEEGEEEEEGEKDPYAKYPMPKNWIEPRLFLINNKNDGFDLAQMSKSASKV